MTRPAISADVQRQIFTEAGHRCAVCGTPFPLERAHIVRWSRSLDHSAENLICLCANCHERSDKDWDEKTLKIYKTTPWILRSHPSSNPSHAEMSTVEVTVDLDLLDFNETTARWLTYALAGFLNVSPEKVSVKGVKVGSVKVTLQMPAHNANTLVAKFKEDPSRINEYCNPLQISSVEPATTSTNSLTIVELRELLKGFLGIKDYIVDRVLQAVSGHLGEPQFVQVLISQLESVGGYTISEDMSLALSECLTGAPITCPRCWGSGYVTWASIERLGMDNLWSPGYCLYCFATGTVPPYLPLVHSVTAPPP